MRNVPRGPHESNDRGNWWNRMGWDSEEEYTETLVAECGQCKRVDVLDDHRGARLCQGCWHSARQSETPYAVYRVSDGYCACNGAYLKEEAEEQAAKLTMQERSQYDGVVKRANDPADPHQKHYADLLDHWKRHGAFQVWPTHEAKPCEHWWGERIAHNGYMARRRATILAAHPEYR